MLVITDLFLLQQLSPHYLSIIFYFAFHNFWTQNPSRSSKVSKDSDCSLVSYKNFSEILPSNSLGLGPGQVGHGGLKFLHLWGHSQKISTPQPKIIFKCRLEDLLHLLCFWTALYRFWRQSYAHAKPRAISCFGTKILKYYQMQSIH